MCGITGFFNTKCAVKHTHRALAILKNRGIDGVGAGGTDWLVYSSDQRILDIPRHSIHILGHRLHSMVSYVNQPIVYEGQLVANCEIYNWKALDKKYGLNSKNDSDLLIKLMEKKISKGSGSINVCSIIEETLREVLGVYAFAYWRNDKVYIVRDILGIKPLWYSTSSGFALASEKKALESTGYRFIKELNPREILCYDINKDTISRYNREFFSITPENRMQLETMRMDFRKLITDAVSIRIPDEPFGVLFSGGVDSTIIAYLCKELGKRQSVDFTCYTAGFKGSEQSPDIQYAQKVAETLGLSLQIKEIDLEVVEKHLKVVVPLIEDTNVPKVGVALTMYVACLAAKEDNIRVMFSGSGADELFAGYDRHRKSTDINRDCYTDILNIYEKNTYRDDVVSMNNNIELRVPYLDKRLVDYCLKVPPHYKIDSEQNKIILRMVAEDIGILQEFAQRRKQAAQYGSRFDRAISKLAKKTGFRTKSEYLRGFYPEPNLKLGVLFSSGKDSNYAMHIMQNQNYSIECLITIRSENPYSYMFHTPNIDLVHMQAEAMDIPLIEQFTKGEKETELEDMRHAISQAKKEFGIEGVVTGALYSNYQRERIERICDELGLKVFSPLWHVDQEAEMRQLLKNGFEFIFSSIAAYGLDKSWLGSRIKEEDIDRLVQLNEKIGINVAGEGGEFESFVTDGPMYKKRIDIKGYEVLEMDEYTARIVITDAELVEKRLD